MASMRLEMEDRLQREEIERRERERRMQEAILLENKRWDSSTLIQSYWKMSKQRKLYQINRLERRRSACLRISRIYRGYRGRIIARCKALQRKKEEFARLEAERLMKEQQTAAAVAEVLAEEAKEMKKVSLFNVTFEVNRMN